MIGTKSNSTESASAVSRKTAYAIAAGAAASGLAAGEASALVIDETVFSSGPLDISINQFGALTLDVDLDGDTDINLQNYVFGGNYQGASVAYFPGQVVGFVSGPYNNNYVTLLYEGDTIDASTVGPSFFGSMAYANNPASQFDSVVRAFLGFSFPNGSDIHYAWARVTIDNAAGTFVLNDYAYETTPGEGILAGEIPEPTSLGLLAAGAAGVGALRSRRRRD